MNQKEKNISHLWKEESMEEKARWFQSLSLKNRMDIFCEITDFVLNTNPEAVEKEHAKSPEGRVRVLTKS